MKTEGKGLLLKTAEFIENGKTTFRSHRNQGVLYNMMLCTDYGYEALYDEQGFYGLLWNGKKGTELDPISVLPRVSKEVEIDESVLREFVGWCNQQNDDKVISSKLRDMFERHEQLSVQDFH